MVTPFTDSAAKRWAVAGIDGLHRVSTNRRPASLHGATVVGGHVRWRQVASEGHPRVEDESHTVIRVPGRGDDFAVEAKAAEQRPALGDTDDQ